MAKKGNKKKKSYGGGLKIKSHKQLKKEEEQRERMRQRNLIITNGTTGLDATNQPTIETKIPIPNMPAGIKSGSLGGPGHVRRKFKLAGSFIAYDTIGVENALIKWRPIEVNNPIEKCVVVLSDKDGQTRQLLWEQPGWVKYFRRYNCLVIMDQAPDLLLGEPIDQPLPPVVLKRKDEESKREKRLKKFFYQALNMQRLEGEGNCSIIILDLPDQIWQLVTPEIYAIGLNCYALFGDLKVMMKGGGDQGDRDQGDRDQGDRDQGDRDQGEQEKQSLPPPQRDKNQQNQSSNNGLVGQTKTWEEKQLDQLNSMEDNQGLDFDQMILQREQENQIVWPSTGQSTVQPNSGEKMISLPPQKGVSNSTSVSAALTDGTQLVATVMEETKCDQPTAEQALASCQGNLVEAILMLN